MNKILLILQREYLQIVKTKLFIISTLLTPVFMVAIMVIPMLLMQFRTGKPEKIAIVDNSDLMIYEELNEKLNSEEFKPGYEVHREEYNLYELPRGLEQLKNQVLSRELDGFLVIEKDILDTGSISYYSKNVSNINTQGNIKNIANEIIRIKRFRMLDLDIADEVLEKYLDPVSMQVIRVSKEGETVDKGQGFIISYIFVLLIYMTILMYGVSVLRGVIQEKSSRVIELIISNVKPFQLLMGKILGIGLVGLTQYAVWLVLGLLLMNNTDTLSGQLGFSPVEGGFDPSMIKIPFSVFAYFAIFFILGYFLYSTLYAAVGSMVDNEQEANNLQTPLIMFLVVPIIIMPMIMQNPDSLISVVLSLFPFFSPMLMFLRINVSQPPFYQILLSIGLMLASIVLCTWLVAKIYRVGILMYGKKANLKDIVRWIRYK